MKRLLPVILFPMLLACPGPREAGTVDPPPTDQNSLAFQYTGVTNSVAGSYGIAWIIGINPSVMSGHQKLRTKYSFARKE